MHHYYKFYKIIKIINFQNTHKENNLKIFLHKPRLNWRDLIMHSDLMLKYHSYKYNEFEQVVLKGK